MSNRHFAIEVRSISPISNWVEVDRGYHIPIDAAIALLAEMRYTYEALDNEVRLVEIFGSEDGGAFTECRTKVLDY